MRKEGTVRINIDIDKWEWEKLGMLAEGLERPRSWVVRRLINEATTYILTPNGTDTPSVDSDRADERGLG